MSPGALNMPDNKIHNHTVGISEINDFWFTPPMSQHWFSSSNEIDRAIRERFEPIWEQAKTGGLDHWKETADGCLALCIVLDQMPLNMFRNEAKSFSTEQQAVAICKAAIEAGMDITLPPEQVPFLYMPLMHSEHIDDQDLAVERFSNAGLISNLRFAQHHRKIIERFGRFPHRNNILGRKNTQDELSYLNSDKAFLG